MKRIAVSAVLALGLASVASGGETVDPKLPEYKPASGVSGTIKSVGSDTMNNLMTLWGEAFSRFYPAVKPEIEGKGSGTAPPALIEGSSTFGPMSRKMKDKEQDAFQGKFGYKAVQLPTALDTLAVYVHKDNPIQSLTLQQVDAIFSKGRKGGHTKDLKTWGDVGATGAWAARPITMYGRNSASGTYGYFKKHALFKGDYKDSVKEQSGSSAVVASVASDLGGIGYSGIGYKTADVKAIALAKAPGQQAHAPTPDNAYASKYPLSRFLWLTVNYKPGSQLDPLRREFVKLVFSKQGQKVVIEDGYLPVPARIADKALASVGIHVPALTTN